MVGVPLYWPAQDTGGEDSGPPYEKLLPYPFCAGRQLGKLYGQGIFRVIMEY